MKLTIFSRILAAILIVALGSLLVVWFLIRPQYEETILNEQLTFIQQVQKSTVNALDNTMMDWTDVSRFIAAQITERPNEGEIILQMMMSLHPEIIQMRIHSPALPDELRSQNTSYSSMNLTIADSVWIASRTDSTLHIAWLNPSNAPSPVFVTQKQFQVQHIPFVLTSVWNAQRLQTVLSEIPLDNDYRVSIYNSSSLVTPDIPSIKLGKTFAVYERSGAIQNTLKEAIAWRAFSIPFQSEQLWMVVAVPEKALLRPVENFLWYSGGVVLGLLFLMILLGWWLSYQMKRFVRNMKTFYNIPIDEPSTKP